MILNMMLPAQQGASVCRKTLLGSKDEVLWRVDGTQYPRNIAPPLGEGLGWGQSFGF